MNKQLIVFLLLLASLIHRPLHAQTKRIAVAYSAISATQSGFYLAKDAKVFDRNGLDVDPVYVAGGSRVSQTVIAGEFTVALAGGNIVFADLAGGDIVTFGGVVNVPSFYLYVQPSIKTKSMILNGREITTGGSIIIPIAMRTLAMTMSITKNGK